MELCWGDDWESSAIDDTSVNANDWGDGVPLTDIILKLRKNKTLILIKL